MSYENPCHYPTDDLVFGSGRILHIVANNKPGDKPPTERLCTLDDEKIDVSDGQWVRYPYPNDEECGPFIQDTNDAEFRDFRPAYYGDRPHCWYREDMTKLALLCGEGGCEFPCPCSIFSSPFHFDLFIPIELLGGDVISHRYITEIRKETQLYAKFEQNDCSYRELGDVEIQKCVDEKRISAIEARGMSISTIVRGYLVQKLRNINMTTAGDGTKTVLLDTLKFPHLLWGLSLDKHRENLENNFPDIANNTDTDHYWISGFYITSEREPHVQVDRSLQFSKAAFEILSPKGYKMINGLDVTAAFAFDSDGQADGMHIGGPPVKAVVQKFFHHLCHDVLS